MSNKPPQTARPAGSLHPKQTIEAKNARLHPLGSPAPWGGAGLPMGSPNQPGSTPKCPAPPLGSPAPHVGSPAGSRRLPPGKPGSPPGSRLPRRRSRGAEPDVGATSSRSHVTAAHRRAVGRPRGPGHRQWSRAARQSRRTSPDYTLLVIVPLAHPLLASAEAGTFLELYLADPDQFSWPPIFALISRHW